MCVLNYPQKYNIPVIFFNSPEAETAIGPYKAVICVRTLQPPPWISAHLGWWDLINFNMPDIWQTLSDSWAITIKQNVRFKGWIWPEIFQLDQIQNDRLVDIIALIIMRNIWKTVPDS